MAELHRRASCWYSQAGGDAEPGLGDHGAFVGEAVRHALAASDYATAVQLVEDSALGMIMQGNFKTVQGWIAAIPREYTAQRPRANVAFAWLHYLQGTMAQAAPYLEQLQTTFAGLQMDETDASLQAEWLALQSIVRNAEGKPAESLALANQALAIVPRTDHRVQSVIYLGMADAYQQVEDPAHAAEACQGVVYHGRAAASLVVETLGIAGSAAMATLRGRLHSAFEIASQGVVRIERSGYLPPISATVYGSLGYVSYQWDRLDDAHRYYQRANRVGALSGYHDTEILYLVTLSRLHQTEGDLMASARDVERAVDLVQGGAAPWLRPLVIQQQVRALLAQENLAASEVVLRQSGVSLHDGVTYPTDALHLAWLRLLLHLGQHKRQKDKLRQASELAQRIIDAAQAGQRVETTLQALILGALVHASSGDAIGSLEMLDRALELAEPEGYVRVFLDEGAPLAGLLRLAQERGSGSGYAAELLARFPSGASDMVLPLGSAGLIEPLSERELEVLRLIGQGCSNEEIAQRLVITLYTVKKHNSNIYGKLAVNSRTHAVARARGLGIL